MLSLFAIATLAQSLTLAQAVTPIPPTFPRTPPPPLPGMPRPPAPAPVPAPTSSPVPIPPAPAPATPATPQILTIPTAPASPTPQRPSSTTPKPPTPKLIPPPELLPLQETMQPQEPLPSLEAFVPHEVRPLVGQLDEIPVFNSNSPEIVQTEGVLLSTFPPDGMQVPSAHLNFAFQGRFDLFSHHIAVAKTIDEARTLFQGVILYNPSDKEVIAVEVLQGASYLTRPDAIFIALPAVVDDPIGTVFAGPGSRAMNDVLRGRRQGNWSADVIIPPKQSRMLMNLPIPVGTVLPSSNGRSTLLRLQSTGAVYVANLAMFAPIDPQTKTERIPTLQEWQDLLTRSGVAGPRDIPPTAPQAKNYTRYTYGRVAGVAVGSQWRSTLTDNPNTKDLTIPTKGLPFSYGLSTLFRGTFGTGQIQSARMLVRYPDTAYQANGNYGIQYSLTLPLHNPTQEQQTVTVSLQTPLKEDSKGGLLFLKPLSNQTFFRGPVRVRYTDDKGSSQTRFVHLVQQRGQEGEPLVTLTLQPGDRRRVEVDLLYPPDSTPPQVLTVKTIAP